MSDTNSGGRPGTPRPRLTPVHTNGAIKVKGMPQISEPPVGLMSSDQRRNQILSSALWHIANQGYQATTMEAIGAAIGMRGPSIYNHFSSKQDILERLVVGPMSELLRRQIVAVSAARTVPEKLRAAYRVHIDFHARHRLEALVGNRALDDLEGDNRETAVNLRSEYERNFRSILLAGIDEGIFQIPNPQMASYAILGMGINVCQWYKPDGPLSPEDVVDAYMVLIEKMVAPTTASGVEIRTA
jgi:AcrR family transcriptional regulator